MKNKNLILKNKRKIFVSHNSKDRYKRKKRKELIIIIMMILIFLSIFFFLNSNYVKLKNINIKGTNQINNEELLKKIEVSHNSKIWKIKSDEIVEKIKNNYNIVKEVEVSKKLLNTLNINIVEKKLLAKEKNKDNNYYNIVMEDGNYNTNIIQNEFNLPIIEKFEHNKEKRIKIIKNLYNLNFEVLTYISEIVNEKNDSEEIIIYMKDGQKIKASFINFSNKLNYYFDMEKHIENKKDNVLNLINGAFLETKKSEKFKEIKIKEIIANTTNKTKENKTEEEKKNSTDTKENNFEIEDKKDNEKR